MRRGRGGASHDLSHYCVLPFPSFLFSLKLVEFKRKLNFFGPLLISHSLETRSVFKGVKILSCMMPIQKTGTLEVANENPHLPALESEGALDRNPLQGPPNPPAIGLGLGDGNAHDKKLQPQQQQQQYEYQLFVNNRTVKFSYILTLFILILQCKVN